MSIMFGIFIVLLIIWLILLFGFSAWLFSACLALLRREPPFVPTSMPVVNLMLSAAKLKEGDLVFDLGCGDGRLIIGAAKRHKIKAVGIERSFFIYLLAKLRRFISKSSVQIIRQDMFQADLSEANVVFCYLFPKTMERLKGKFEKESPWGARIISHAFQIENWKPIKEIKIKDTSVWVYETGKSNLPR